MAGYHWAAATGVSVHMASTCQPYGTTWHHVAANVAADVPYGTTWHHVAANVAADVAYWNISKKPLPISNPRPHKIELAPGPSRKRSTSPSSPSYPDATTFSNGEPAASESPELNPEDLTARLEDIKVEIDTLHADREDKEVLISELQGSLAASENEIAVLQLRVDDDEARQAKDHAQIQSILARLGL
nr:hypothetical protein [Tanacetum cinerariifolium]